MLYAKLTKLAGELIAASDADYEDYKGFLRCPECGEPVFLRKSHRRGTIEIPSAFIHHRAIPQVSQCELRVIGYSKEEFEKKNAIARGQRVQKLQISMWKFLKKSLAIDFRKWEKCSQDAKKVKMYRDVIQYGKTVLEGNIDFILNNTFPRISELFLARDKRIGIAKDKGVAIKDFLDSRERDWKLHSKLAYEAMELFLKSAYLEEVRVRVLTVLCHPASMEFVDSNLLDLDASTDEWRSKFVSYLSLQICFVFLTVDWMSVFGE